MLLHAWRITHAMHAPEFAYPLLHSLKPAPQLLTIAAWNRLGKLCFTADASIVSRSKRQQALKQSLTD